MSKAPIARQAVVWAAGIIIGLVTTTRADPPRQPDDLLKPLQAFADNLVQHARDKYGPKQTPLFVSQLEIETKRIPPAETELYGKGHRGGAGVMVQRLFLVSKAEFFGSTEGRITWQAFSGG